MRKGIFLKPGDPNDDNREYLPDAIENTDMVVNENGNNSQPMMDGLTCCRETLVDDKEDVWYEYVPSSYNASQKVPLVFSMHGGLMTGWGQAVYTSWTLIAEREGLIVVFPNASARKVWTVEVTPEMRTEVCTPNEQDSYLNMPPDDLADNRDVRFVLKLLERLQQQYNIDEERIYMQGMSMGDLMTSQFARRYWYLLAGAAGSGMPTDPKLLFAPDGTLRNASGPLDVWNSRLELDAVPPHYGTDTQTAVLRNIAYWHTVNHCEKCPEIRITGEDNIARFSGPAGYVILRDVHNRDHGQTFDDAEMVWNTMFSGVRRKADGTLVHIEPELPFMGDTQAIAIADGCETAWLHNSPVPIGASVFTWRKLKYHGLNGDAVVRGAYLYVPLRFIAEAFGANRELSVGGLAETLILKDGQTLQFARGSIGCIHDGRVEAMLCEAVFREGELCIPLAWFCHRLFNWHVSECNEVLYATDHYAMLSSNMAELIRNLLAGS